MPIETNQPAEIITEQPDNEQTRMFEYQPARVHLQRLVDDWKNEVEETEVRRSTRKVDIKTEELRQRGQLDEDETLIPVRVIDMNITREQPPYVNYLKNSRRVAIFTPLSNPEQDTGKLEEEFTRIMTYESWEVPHFKCLEGSQVHGWDAVEVEFDDSKPGNVGISHIGHDMLFFPKTISDIQQAPRVIRAYDVTILQLRNWVAYYNFDAEQIDLIYNKKKATQKEAEVIRIYKLYFKVDGVVHVSWFTLTEGSTDWLKKPEKLFLGIRRKETIMINVDSIDPITNLPTVVPQPQEQWVDEDIKEYPIFLLYYRETEEPKITDHKGRVFMDENKQEAQTAILSSFVNGLTRASNIYASPETEDGSGAALKELEVKLTPGRILSKPIKYWAPPYPDPLVLRFMQYADTANAQETNQVNFAAMNREDSRKTATEIEAASSQQTLINSVQLTLFSTYIRKVYTFAWQIVRSQALQDKITFYLVQIPGPPDPMSGQPTGMSWKNNYEVISQVFDVRAAGDVDVVQRDEKIQKMMQDWPVIQQTALKDVFLTDLIKLKYPDVGDRYVNILQQSAALVRMQSMIQRLSTVMEGMVQQNPQMLEQIPPQSRSELTAMMQEAKTYGGGMNGQPS